MPRMNGRRDTTGLCGKLGSAIQDKLDELEFVLKIKRRFDSTWNGKLFLIVEHFGDDDGVLDEDGFKNMFMTVGDGFVDATSYADAVRTFGTAEEVEEGAPAAQRVLDIAAIEAIYSLGCRTWREKHVQVERDFERFKIISDEFDQTHSDFLVITGSLGSEGMIEVRSAATDDSVLGRANAQIALAANGGVEFATAVDEEFSVEEAMTEAQRFTVALPSLYVETCLFALIAAFIFLYVLSAAAFQKVQTNHLITQPPHLPYHTHRNAVPRRFLHDNSKDMQLKYFPLAEDGGAEGGVAGKVRNLSDVRLLSSTHKHSSLIPYPPTFHLLFRSLTQLRTLGARELSRARYLTKSPLSQVSATKSVYSTSSLSSLSFSHCALSRYLRRTQFVRESWLKSWNQSPSKSSNTTKREIQIQKMERCLEPLADRSISSSQLGTSNSATNLSCFQAYLFAISAACS